MAICDRCSTNIATGEGYCVYSEAQFGEREVGAMLLCENCANKLFTEKVWNDAKHLAIEIDFSSGFDAMNRAQTKANDFSVAMRAKRRRLSPTQARQEAREIAQLWWKNQGAAAQRLLAQSSAPRVGTKSEDQKKRWWEFWR